MTEPTPEYILTLRDDRRVDHFMRMRAVTIQYLKMLEDELIAMNGLRPDDRACITREERRAKRAAIIDIAQQQV